MKIAIMGTGNVGRALGEGWAKAGHDVYMGTRRPEDPDLGALSSSYSQLKVCSPPEAFQASEVILLAIPPGAIKELLSPFDLSQNKIWVDATNTVKPEGAYEHVSAAIRDIVGQAEIVKCFNTTGFENMIDPCYGDQAVDMFMAGDSAQAKEVARQLALDLGFGEVYDFGGFEKIGLLEKFALSWINLAIFQGHGRGIGFKMLKR